ncbi:acyltransferase family protein [Clostridium aminobutyricum]|uniref:Acyltransferase family protein n=1 Tax=Clostridium aminobutyricum TaxID=33953 RepID=A0A939D915_CLOAM|nr:acyltransferase family protein [Clostridium aminobutyricum]MBN7773355.1 acyltransferase family protein [Clostridium aminobutyricum]
MENTLNQIKQRDYKFDNLRGLLIWTIPISHFTRMGGDFAQASLGGLAYITINVFVMQAFMFLSGYFSKNVEKARNNSFETFMLPYLFFTVVFYIFRYCYFGEAKLNFLKPPFALWFLFSAFFYRFFLKDLVKIRHLLPISLALYIFAGQIYYLNDDLLALGRTVSYFPFFLLGYYCSSDRIKKLQQLKIWQTFLLGAALLGVSYLLAYHVDIPVEFYLLRTTGEALGVVWYADIFMRVVILLLSCAWILLMFNLLPNKNNYLAYVGVHTMPIYILHLFFRYYLKKEGFPFTDPIAYYLGIFGFASLCVVIFSSPPIAKAYDKTLKLIYSGWLKLKKYELKN